MDGLEKMKIPAGIQPGKVLRLRSKGVPRLRGNGRGDQLVVVNVEIPKTLSSEQRQLFEQLAHSLGSEVNPAERGFLDWLKETLGGRSRILITLAQADAAAAQREFSTVTGVTGLEVLEQTDGHLRLQLDCALAADPRPELYRRIKQTSWVLLDFHQHTQSLEAVFRELTKES